YTEHGTWHLASLDTETRKLDVIETSYTEIWDVRTALGRVVCGVGSPTEPAAIVRFDPATRHFDILWRSSTMTIDPGYLSVPQAIEFPTERGLIAHALFYAPRNRDYLTPSSERPPLLVKSHGGPTSVASTTLNLGIQYWTSRGIAVLDVNYGGSTGYGRTYRERLKGQWGGGGVYGCFERRSLPG